MSINIIVSEIAIDLSTEVSGSLNPVNIQSGAEGEILAISGGLPSWISPTITGSYSPTLAVRAGSGGSLTSQLIEVSDYVLFPKEQLCFFCTGFTYSGVSFGGGTILEIELPFNINVSSNNLERQKLVHGYERVSSMEFNNVSCDIFNGGTFGQKNLFINNPTLLSAAGGGHGSGNVSGNKVLVTGYYKVEI